MCAELYKTVFYPRHTSSDLSTCGFCMRESPRFLKLGILYTAERVDVFLYLLKGTAV